MTSTAEQIQSNLMLLAAFNTDELGRQLESVNEIYSAHRDHIAAVCDLAKTMENLTWEKVSTTIQLEAHEATSNLLSNLQHLKSFKLDVSRPPQEQGTKLFSIFNPQPHFNNKSSLQFYAIRLASLAGIALITDGAFQKMEAAKDRYQANIDETERYLASKRAEIEAIYTAAATAAAKVGAERHATEFQSLASEHKRVAYGWLGATIFFNIVAFAVLYIVFDVGGIFSQTDRDLSLGQIAPRVLLVSLLYTLALWASRNYKSHRHLNVVNRHRACALSTFRAFVLAAGEDKDIKNGILQECTKSIFGHVSTGYLENDASPLNSTVVDVVRSVTRSEGTKV